MPAVNYIYSKPSDTFTINQFIACQSDYEASYYNFSFIDTINYDYMNETIHYAAYNVISDYLDEIRDKCIQVKLSDAEMMKYIYRPKLLAYDIYKNQELAFLILIINDMYSIKQFTKNKLLLPRKNDMIEICKQLFNSNKQSINKYNALST